MTLVLIEKGLALEGWPSKIEVSWVLGKDDPLSRVGPGWWLALSIGNSQDNTEFHAAIAGAVSGAYHARAVAEQYGVPVILHTDHCAKKFLGPARYSKTKHFWVEMLISTYFFMMRHELESTPTDSQPFY